MSARLAVLAWALATCAGAAGQVSIDETAIQAKVVNGKTVVAVPVRNDFNQSIHVRTRLEWVDASDQIQGAATSAGTLNRGPQTIDIDLPIPLKGDALLYRLRYALSADQANLTLFRAATGVVSLPSIASYAFELKGLAIGEPRAGQPYPLQVYALHPVTHQPVAGAVISAGAITAKTDDQGLAVLLVRPDIEDWTDDDTIDVKGRTGDFAQEIAIQRPGLARSTLRITTDKPLYQPGQTMHVRMLSFGADRRALAAKAYTIRIEDEKSTVYHVADVKTSNFGIAATDWEIPPNALSGVYNIEISPEDDDDTPSSYSVNIRRYELPSFRVMVEPDRPFYLPGQNATVRVRADYLFGKPVAQGDARIATEDDKREWKGEIDGAGTFTASIDLSAYRDKLGDKRYLDIAFKAYVTDATTKRTEERRFDLRLSRDPIHVYLVGAFAATVPHPVYVSAYTPDGKPSDCDLEILLDEHSLARVHTNRYGVARADVMLSGGEVTVRALVRGAAVAEYREPVSDSGQRLVFTTDHGLYKRGQPIQCDILADKADLRAVVMMTADGSAVYSRAVKLNNGRARVDIPYDERFGRMPRLSVASIGGREYSYSRPVMFPGPDNISVDARPLRQTCRPGEEAVLSFHTTTAAGVPVAAALGMAVVDQSVFERAATDAASGRRRWFLQDAKETAVGGFTISDLLDLRMDRPDIEQLQTVAETLLCLNAATEFFQGDEYSSSVVSGYAGISRNRLAKVIKALDAGYQENLQHPRDADSLQAVAAYALSGTTDPWDKPFRTEFATEGQFDTTRFVSSGPDKRFGTDDDFTAATIERKWFLPETLLVSKALAKTEDYPATAAEVEQLIEQGGLRLSRRTDPWGSAMRLRVRTQAARRVVEVQSPGPDRAFGTNDDVAVAQFEGEYFRSMRRRIEDVLVRAADFPRDHSQLRALLSKSGIDPASVRDPWGQAYRASFRSESTFGDRTEVYTYSEYNGIPEQRQVLKPVTQTTLHVTLRSSGADGIEGSYDDFTIADFIRIVDKENAPETPRPDRRQPALTAGGTGRITGVVTDASGAVIPNAQVKLKDLYDTTTDSEGRFWLYGVPEGRYRITVFLAGFQSRVVDAVPVHAGQTTRVDTVLDVGGVSQTIAVEATVYAMQTENSELAVLSVRDVATTTPRVREYFPETLYWQPELITSASGEASVKFKLADSITTWHVAVIASTVDGRIVEGETEIRAFQPFFIDLNPPPILTAGDEISLPVPLRNYMANAQTVKFSLAAGPGLKILEAQDGTLAISAGSTAVRTPRLQANSGPSETKLRATASGKSAGDAIEKPIVVHPDGEEVSRTAGELLTGTRQLKVEIPPSVIPGSLRAELKIYPNVLAHLIDSLDGILRRPYGCGEQTISSTYPNLLVLRAVEHAGFGKNRIAETARRNLNAGYQRLLGYRTDEGGFAYWHHENADVALTVYAIQFLEDAKALIAVQPEIISEARQWVGRRKDTTGIDTLLRARGLVGAGPRQDGEVLRHLSDVGARAASEGDPYWISTFILACMEASKPELATAAVERLKTLALRENGEVYWHQQTNTPYYGWGHTGRIETTGLAMSALARWKKLHQRDQDLDSLIGSGILFLLRNKDGSGVWHSTHATVQVLMAITDALSAEAPATASADVFIDGKRIEHVLLPQAAAIAGPITVDVSAFLKPGAGNAVTVAIPDRASTASAQLVATWYEPWSKPRTSSSVAIKAEYSRTHMRPNEIAECDVTVSRPSFRGYGMMVTEVGLPPGAEVDRGTLDDAIQRSQGMVSAYEIAPDRVIFYVWPHSVADVRIRFAFRPRYPIRARTAPSTVYDYYNPDARAVVPPVLFSVE